MLKQDRYSAIRRLLARGADITDRTRLTMQYVREGWPKGRITPRQRRAIASAIIVWQQFPSMCLRLRQIHAQHQQREQDMMAHYCKTYTTAVKHIQSEPDVLDRMLGRWI